MGLSRVWILDGCILCNLCREISPDVFATDDGHYFVQSDADLDAHEEEIRQAALDCPVDVIRFEED